MITQNGDLFTLGSCGYQHEKLPVGYYMVADHPKIGLHLKSKEAYKIPRKIYGDVSDAKIWEKTWKRGNLNNMGVLLYGMKGAGKSMEGHIFAQSLNCPIILINQPFHDEYFFDFITDPSLSGSVLFFDEFEKVYHKDEWQGRVLSLFDGTMQGQVFIVTINDESKVRTEFFNRPGRLRYAKEYHSLGADVVESFLKDNNMYEGAIDDLKKIHTSTGIMTFDLLATLHQEHMIHGDDLITCANRMNLMKEETTVELLYSVNGIEISFGFENPRVVIDEDDDTVSVGMAFQRHRLDRMTASELSDVCKMGHEYVSRAHPEKRTAEKKRFKETIESGDREVLLKFVTMLRDDTSESYWIPRYLAKEHEDGITLSVPTGIPGFDILIRRNPFKTNLKTNKIRLKPQHQTNEQPTKV